MELRALAIQFRRLYYHRNVKWNLQPRSSYCKVSQIDIFVVWGSQEPGESLILSRPEAILRAEVRAWCDEEAIVIGLIRMSWKTNFFVLVCADAVAGHCSSVFPVNYLLSSCSVCLQPQ